MPRQFVAIDAEGDTGSRGLLGVAFYSAERQCYLTDHAAITAQLEWFARHGYTFLAHNAEYDAAVIFWQLHIPLKVIYFNNTFNRGEWNYAPRRPAAQLWDTLDLSGGAALMDLGTALGCPKYATPQVLRGLDPNRWEWFCAQHNRGECLECYALRDAEIVYRYMESLAAVVGQWGVSVHRRIGSTGVAVWKSLDTPAPIRLKDARCRFLGRAAYYGGRVECFKLGHFAPLYGADVASMYPAVMAATPFPHPDHMVHVYAIPPDAVPWEYEGVAECTVYVPHMYIPPLPTAHRGRRVFATGLQRGHWTLHELRYAQSLGVQVRQVHRACWSAQSISPFTLFVGTLWAMREDYLKHHDPRAQAVKAMLNHTYGRFGMSYDLSMETVEEWDHTKPWSAKTGARPFPQFGTLYQRTWTRAPFDYHWTNELWAAQITAAARVKLHRYLALQGDAVVYCDTDSVFSLQPIQGIGEGLGALVDHTTYTQAWMVGPKLYRLEAIDGEMVYKAKGVKRELAARFLSGDAVVMESTITPLQAAKGKGHAGQWIPITRQRQLVPATRTPLTPEAAAHPYGWSDTVPPVAPSVPVP